MKKTSKSGKLVLTTEKVRDLSSDHLDNIAGGTSLVYQPITIQQTPLAQLSTGGQSAGVTRGSIASKSESGFGFSG